MRISQAMFVSSSITWQQCPDPQKPAFAFVGRSNVGKSSLINMLLARKNLAKTSSTPGKTQHINYFLVNNAWYLVDLPGYGWAKVSKQKKSQWQDMARGYLRYSTSLVNVFLLVDARHLPQPSDLAFVNWLGVHQLPCAVVFTKQDKCASLHLKAHMLAFQQTMLQHWLALPPFFTTSAIKKKGRKELLLYIKESLP